ncbi:MAG TPA: HAMP domain-containing sensor histidine kinase [Sphingomonas sp.]|nr:HAMP domain-containing sensor histidine kinase [Sphingomonas sp.]
MIRWIKTIAKRHWPRLRMRTILLSTFILIATLPGFGALFLRVYENTLVRQTETELTAESAALAATAGAQWPGFVPGPVFSDGGGYGLERRAIDLRTSPILPDRPAPVAVNRRPEALARAVAARIQPILRQTTYSTLASILLLDRSGIVLNGPQAGLSYRDLPEVAAALRGRPNTVLRRNAAYHRAFPVEWFSRAAALRLHHAHPIIVNGRTMGVVLLARSPPALYMGLYEDAGKIAFGFALIMLVIVVLSGLLSRGIIRPIEKLGLATRDVARGSNVVMPAIPETAAIEIQALYADFAAMAAAIERRSRYLRDFAHAVSHEFKTPLAGIRGAVELLQDHHATMSQDERHRFLGNAAVDADRLTLLVTRLLELARADMMTAGGASNLALALRRVADAHRGAAFAVDLTIAANLPYVAVPAATVETVIGALIENSRQAGATRCTIRVIPRANSIHILLGDNGPGINSADRERLFEPFFTTRRAAGGTGLGLPIARSLLDACNGAIRLENSETGAQFSIDLPLA